MFLNQYFLLFINLLTAEDLLVMIPANLQTQKLTSLQPTELTTILLRPGNDINITTWGIIVSHYTNISNLRTVLALLTSNTVNLTKENQADIFATAWSNFLNALNEVDLTPWLNDILPAYISFITTNQLNVSLFITVDCTRLRKLVMALTDKYEGYTEDTQRIIYSSLKDNLLQPGDKPRCYDATEANSTSWFSNNLGKYMNFTSVEDLKSFANETMLQLFSVDINNLNLVGMLNLTEAVKIYYANLIAEQNPSISVASIPKNLLCYVVQNLTIEQTDPALALSILQTLSTCNSATTQLKPEMLTALLQSLDKVSLDTLRSLGPLVAGFSPSALIEKIDGSVLLADLSRLGTYDWSPTQASIIVSKVIASGFQINGANVILLGKLIPGCPAGSMDTLTKSDVQMLAQSVTFTSYMETAPTALKHRFVQQLMDSTTGDILQLVPDNLAAFIPLLRLVLPTIDINKINTKKWTSSQARVFYQPMLKSTPVEQYPGISSSVMQGFTCGASNFLDGSTFGSLIKAMRGKDVNLPISEFGCMTRRLTVTGSSADLTSYPNDVLLYVGPDKFTSDCAGYFGQAGKAHLNLLPQGSAKRQALLTSARSCLAITSAPTPKNTITTLGNLSCDLSGSEIANADPYILTGLQDCTSFTDAQTTAIESQLTTKYGPSSTWTPDTLTDMANLAGSLQSGTLSQISQKARKTFYPGYLGELKKTNMEQFRSCTKQLQNSNIRARRDTGSCPSTVLTTDLVVKQKDLIPAEYTTSDELDSCLPNNVLKDNLEQFGQMEFSNELLTTLKKKLDTIFGGVPPEVYLPQLGNISRIYTPTEIGQFNITNIDTFSALLEKTSWQNESAKVQALVTRYLNTGGQLNGTALTVLAPYICALQESDLNTTSDNDLRAMTAPLDVSSCTQTKKDLLFQKLKSAYASSRSSANAYYEMMEPVMGGAKAVDLVEFSKGSPVMSITTFAGLNPEEVKKLSAQVLLDLLGPNVDDLKTIQNGTVVQAWVSVHSQAEVNSLGLSLVAGIKEPLPDGFIDLPMKPSQASGASSWTKIHSLSLVYRILLACTVTAFVNTMSTIH